MAALEGELERSVSAIAVAERCSGEEAAKRLLARLRESRERAVSSAVEVPR
jgi:hypothetical protein